MPWLALAIAVSWTTYGYLKKQVPLTPVESMAAESFILLVPGAACSRSRWPAAPAASRTARPTRELAFALFTGLATVGPLMLFAYAAQRVPLTIIGPMQYIVPSMNFLIGWLIYDESLPPSRLLGFALVWVGLAVLTVDSARRRAGRRACPSRR